MKFNQPWKGKPSLNSSKKNTIQYPPRDVEKCAQCGRLHLEECRTASRTCFRCEKPNHFIKLDCPNNSNKGTPQLEVDNRSLWSKEDFLPSRNEMRKLHQKWYQVFLIFALKLLMFYLILALHTLLYPLLLLIYYT